MGSEFEQEVATDLLNFWVVFSLGNSSTIFPLFFNMYKLLLAVNYDEAAEVMWLLPLHVLSNCAPWFELKFILLCCI